MNAELRVSARPGLVALFLFATGFCALTYQTVWLRELRDVFGASTAATAAVVGIFMFGLGAGGLRFGRVVDRSRNPLHLYSMLEMGVTISTLASIPLLVVVEKIYYGTGGSVSLGISGATLFRLLLSVALLGLPTFLMGGTLPAAARAVVAIDDVRRRSVAMLYGVNTLGAVAGALVSTFFALEIFGNQKTLVLACLVNAIVVIAARAHARGAEMEPENEESDREPEATDAGLEPVPPRVLVLTGAVITGFVFMLMEMVWYRVLAPVLGGSTYTFGLILAMALFGIGLGGLVYSVFGSRRPATVRLLALTCAGEALAIAVAYALGDRLAIFAAFLLPMESFGFIGRITAWTMVSTIVVVPASAIAGYQFPLLIALAGRAGRHVGLDVGRVYAFNTIGAIAGSLCGGFGLMPLLTAEGCWAFSGWVMVALALVAAVWAPRSCRVGWGAIGIAAFAGTLFALSAGPSAVWRHSPIGAGRVRIGFQTKAQLKNWERSIRRSVVWEREGVESAVAVVGSKGYAFVINGKIDGHAVGDAGTQVMGGLIGAIQHDDPKRSLVIGLGTGSTAGWLAAVPGMERVDVVELEPAVVDVARFCAPVNRHVLDQENVRVLVGDAREVLLAGDEKYDLIFSEPSNPYRAGIASLFTREFYAASRSRLNENGLFMQWVQGYDITPRTLETILATIQNVFPHLQIWQTLSKDIVVIAATRPLPVRHELIRERLSGEPYKRAAAIAWKVASYEEFLAHYVTDERLIERAIDANDADINSDDRNLVEFGFARSVGVSHPTNLRDVARQFGVDRLPPAVVNPMLVRRFTVTSPFLDSAESDRGSPLYMAVAAYRGREFDAAATLWGATGLEPITHSETVIVAHSLAEVGADQCFEYAGRLAKYSETESVMVRGICQTVRHDGDSDEVAQMLGGALAAVRDDPWVDVELVMATLQEVERLAPHLNDQSLQALADALEDRFSVSLAEEKRSSVHLMVARLAEHDRCGDRTIRALHSFEPWVPWEEEILRVRSHCYSQKGDPLSELARSEYVEYQLDEASTFGAGGAAMAGVELREQAP